jgi:hypothetical protein
MVNGSTTAGVPEFSGGGISTASISAQNGYYFNSISAAKAINSNRMASE